jgi:hypothetical protein
LRASTTLQGKNKEQWMELCTQIAEEEDRHQLVGLVDELNLMLEEEGKRLGILPQEPAEYSPLQELSYGHYAR